MIRKILFIFLLCSTCSFVLADSEEVDVYQADSEEMEMYQNEGSSVAFQPGIIWRNVSKTQYGYGMLNWRFLGQYKYQRRDEIYANLLASYAFGDCTKDDADFRNYSWEAEGSVGWTFGLSEEFIISPFLGFGYNFIKEKRDHEYSINERHDDLITDIRFYGFYAHLGCDAKYFFSSKFSIGLLAKVGMHINPESSYQKTHEMGAMPPTHPKGMTFLDPKEKCDAKNRVFFKASLPILYYINNFKIGVELNYSYLSIKAKNPSQEAGPVISRTVNDFGAALVAGVCF